MSDPKPWRLEGGGDPNAETSSRAWWDYNKKVAKRIFDHKADFHIVNGDLTEFGRQVTYNDYQHIYHNDNGIRRFGGPRL